MVADIVLCVSDINRTNIKLFGPDFLQPAMPDIPEMFADIHEMPWLWAMFGSILVGLSGVLPLLVIPIDQSDNLKQGASANTLKSLLSFAVGALLGDVFLHSLPEIWANNVSKFGNQQNSGLLILCGLITFVAAEKLFSVLEANSAEDEKVVQKNENNNVKGLPSNNKKHVSSMTATEDSMDDDVFETQEDVDKKFNLLIEDQVDCKTNSRSPTGYRGYQPPSEVLNLCRSNVLDDVEIIVHKTILLGDSGVGKTSLLVKFDTGRFESGKFSATVGIGFTTKLVEIDKTKVKLQIWDTAGQERFRSVTHAYYRDAHALLLLYDVTNKNSFDNIRAWLGEIRDYAQDDVAIMLLGNKADCGNERAIRREEGERLAREYNVAFMETSAKSGQNVDLAFHAVAKELKYRQNSSTDSQRFNVQDYVRVQSQNNSLPQHCPPCNY